ncbi:MAG TPA: LL-diaminopimelate aminotransferase [Fermentimonas caenicola]|jgi:LL-diaminopimelate aminotransferase|uniref:LL-diaminopimelate aminotransferase n=1 Tax=Lascolabacillus TaxID=1924067 RepID=UPI0006B36BDE|nr:MULTISPECIES: LL-diaminopimelate aminotransferase [Lascolabacillus]MBP6175435.1 LL-diaminopimelate aminotransferase [Fermentimonas sp.]MDI9625312.1 LL-diaminopimelate aminotransferase [Bacteroidota bacterium]TAH60674.1 MAG: LL-diaminopimelate aminotransferase [Fermentimonas caenicola]MBP6196461.1 LL-diaminopimelate aminotransferase [Fermentimonas sp.]MBP7104737.1 LL-diaminopimelate aminotransferase [Fermentimonas sp.]
MFKVNENYLFLKESYLFSTIAEKVEKYKTTNPGADLIRLGIGDVTLPLPPSVIKAIHTSADEMGSRETFRGYGPEQGYSFLRDKIVEIDYLQKGIEIANDEVFISDGSKSDTGNIGDILGEENVVAITDPVYPVYLDTTIMRIGKSNKILLLECEEDNGFLPQLPKEHVDVVYLCYPNNPTGTVMTKSELKRWVDWALENNSLILFDSAYEAYIQDENVPKSIYEIENAERCAIEFRSFSKNAGFTGLRCSYTVVPMSLKTKLANGTEININKLWNRRQSTKFNGTPYIVQRAAEAIYTTEGQREVKEMVAYYMNNANIIRQGLINKGWRVFGGENSPYVWMKCPNGLDSWEFFDHLLNKCHIVGTPGVGFGSKGQGYFRLTAFNSLEKTVEAVERIISVQ